ncbi:uncharacterized protein [Solanum lycopersicum]|uniref:uncharacterized protein n=1 Tax=Solanum lycopersicum TaxID=4081 RepID=UPI003749E4D4
MTVQEYGLKFNQLSGYGPHMIADSRAQMNKFLYGVSDLVKTECINAMLLGDMIISRLVIHAHQVEGNNLRDRLRKIRRLGLGTTTILSRNRVVEIARRVRRIFQLQSFHHLVFHPPRIGKEGYFGCGQSSHRLRDCPSRQGQGGGNDRAQSTNSAAPESRPTQQGTSSGTGGS